MYLLNSTAYCSYVIFQDSLCAYCLPAGTEKMFQDCTIRDISFLTMLQWYNLHFYRLLPFTTTGRQLFLFEHSKIRSCCDTEIAVGESLGEGKTHQLMIRGFHLLGFLTDRWQSIPIYM